MAGDKPWPTVPVSNRDTTNAAVVIIGGGISGMCTAIDLIRRDNCRNFVILEKSASLGGTWNDNKYPGCCCDVPSILYSYSFAKNPDWTRQYPGQEELHAYLIRVAQQYNLYHHFRFNSTVEQARWDDDANKWHVRVRVAAGSKEAEYIPEYTIKTDFLVSGVGQLNQPQWPDIDGIDDFSGKKIHSARWDWSYDLEGKNIALIGNGCTAVQILPEIAKVAKHVTVFQRTPNWIVPRMDAPVSSLTHATYRYVPGALALMRGIQMDIREWNHGLIADTTSFNSRLLKGWATDLLRKEFADDDDLRDKLTPKYKFGAKRIIASDDYFPALNRPNVTLETRPISHFASSEMFVNDGSDSGSAVSTGVSYDLLVCATGFKTLDFMAPINLYGHKGRSIRDVWADGAQALYGVTVEDMPNFAMLYGPNTNLGHNSIILMIEAQSRYISELVRPVLAARRAGNTLSLTPNPSRLKDYNAEIQAELRSSVWNDDACTSWYKNAAGLITNNWPRTVVAYQKLLERVCFAEDFVAAGTGADDFTRRTRRVVHIGRVREETLSERVLVVLGLAASAAVVAGGIALRNRIRV